MNRREEDSIEPGVTSSRVNRVVERDTATKTSPLLICESCDIEFATRGELAGHREGKHRSQRCVTCGEDSESTGKLGRHKIEVPGYLREQLVGNRDTSWNKGISREQTFGTTKQHQGDPDFAGRLNSPEMVERKEITRQHHEDTVCRKELELRERGFRTFCASNYMRHKRLPGTIAISPTGKVVAVEMESMLPHKQSIEFLREKYTALLKDGGLFEDVVLEGFLQPKLNAQGSNTQSSTN